MDLPRAIVSEDVESLQVGEDTTSVDIASSNGHPHTARVGVNRCNHFGQYCSKIREEKMRVGELTMEGMSLLSVL